MNWVRHCTSVLVYLGGGQATPTVSHGRAPGEKGDEMSGTETQVVRLPACDLPHKDAVLAYADARLRSGPNAGMWAYVCRSHFRECGCQLGLGHGQELLVVGNA